MSETKRLFIFGFGYSAAALARQLMPSGWQITATSRHLPKRKEMKRLGINAYDFTDSALESELEKADYLLSSIPPSKLDDTVLRHYGDVIASHQWEWIGYLSTTGVYGDHQGEWVDETTPVKGSNERTRKRVVAERKWMSLYEDNKHPVHLFRLAGIYGPGRGVVTKLKSGMSQRIYKKGQVFSRIHVQDIAHALYASMLKPSPGAIYNVCDDEPEASHEVVEYAAKAMGLEVPPLVDWQEASMSEMAKEFYSSNRRIHNERIKALLPNGEWLYPTYQQGMMADIKALNGEVVRNDEDPVI